MLSYHYQYTVYLYITHVYYMEDTICKSHGASNRVQTHHWPITNQTLSTVAHHPFKHSYTPVLKLYFMKLVPEMCEHYKVHFIYHGDYYNHRSVYSKLVQPYVEPKSVSSSSGGRIIKYVYSIFVYNVQNYFLKEECLK